MVNVLSWRRCIWSDACPDGSNSGSKAGMVPTWLLGRLYWIYQRPGVTCEQHCIKEHSVPLSIPQLASTLRDSAPRMIFTGALFAISLVAVNAAPSPTSPRPGLELVERDEFVRRDADAPPFVKRAASCTFPTPPKTSSLSAPITVTGGLPSA
jgi:hypothetical protein